MRNIKKMIIEILNEYSDTVHGKGSCGELGDSFQALDSDCFGEVSDEIINKLYPKETDVVDKSNFDEAVGPAIRYLLNNHNPHTKIYIDYSKAELLQGQRCHNLDSEVPD